jgi:hypothetical protein
VCRNLPSERLSQYGSFEIAIFVPACSFTFAFTVAFSFSFTDYFPFSISHLVSVSVSYFISFSFSFYDCFCFCHSDCHSKYRLFPKFVVHDIVSPQPIKNSCSLPHFPSVASHFDHARPLSLIRF